MIVARPAARSRRPVAVPVAALLALAGTTGLAACGADPLQPRPVAAAGDAPASGSEDTAPAELPGGIGRDELEDQTGKAEVVVTVVDNNYEPRAITVSPGTKVTFRNTGANPHNVIPTDAAFPAIPTGELDPKTEASVLLSGTGTFGYHCSIHGTPNKGQRGVIVVA